MTPAYSPEHPPQAIVFDNDGMLLDTEESWSRAEGRLFARYGRSFGREHKRALMGTSGTVAGALLAGWLEQPGRDRELMEEVVELVHEEVARGVVARPGAPELLAALVDAGRPIALASNSSRRFVDEVLAGAGLDGLLAVTVSSEEVAAPKPAPDVYLEALRRLGADPGRSIGFEDSLPGIEAAKAAGMLVVGVPSVDGMALAPPADVELPSLADPRTWALCGLARASH